MANSTQEFMERVADATQFSSFAVNPTSGGFDLRTNIGDESFLENLRISGVAQAHIHHVEVGDGMYTITSDSRDLAWGDGVPMLATPKEIRTAARSSTTRVLRDSTPGPVNPHSLEAGRSAITGVGDALGLTQKQTGRRLEIALTAAAIILTVALSFAVAAWVLFLR